jgi:glutathione S-transferase
MKLYVSGGPNPRAVTMFAAEKGLDVPTVALDVAAGENRQPPHLARNPLGTTPVLELDGGVCVSDVIAICEYFEELRPDPPLIGASPEQRAETRMWTRRIDLLIADPMVTGFRAADRRDMFRSRIPLVSAAAGEELKGVARAWLLWLDRQMADRDFICGQRFSLADIMLFAFARFGEGFGQPLPEEAASLRRWYERVAARPSAAA